MNKENPQEPKIEIAADPRAPTPRFKVGDVIRIVGYGHQIWYMKEEWARMYAKGLVSSEKPKNLIKEDEITFIVDMSPELVGKTGKVVSASSTGVYSLSGVSKRAWYYEEQLELISARLGHEEDSSN